MDSRNAQNVNRNVCHGQIGKVKKIFRNSITIVLKLVFVLMRYCNGQAIGARRGLICTIITTGLQAGGCATCQSLTVSTVSNRSLEVEHSKPLKRLMPSVCEDTGLTASVNESSDSQARLMRGRMLQLWESQPHLFGSEQRVLK